MATQDLDKTYTLTNTSPSHSLYMPALWISAEQN